MRNRFTLACALAACVAAVAAAGPAAAAEVPLTLPEAVAIALANHPSLSAAAGRESAARAALDLAGSARWPHVDLDSRVGHVSEVPETVLPGVGAMPLAEKDSWVTTATLGQLLFTGGRVSALVRQAGQGEEAARAAGLRVRQLTAYGAERAFRLLLAAQAATEAAALTLAAAEDHLKVASERLEARVAARFDVLRAEVAAQEARQEVIAAEAALQSTRAQLLQALGVAAGEFRAVPPPPADASPRPPVEALLADAGRLRPDLAALARQVAAAEEGVRAARAERAPTVGMAADYQLVTPESTTQFTRWSVGAALSLPILDGGRITARCGEAEAALVQARAALEAGRRQVEVDVRQALAHDAAAAAQVVVAARRVEQAEELSRLAGVRFAGGVGTATEIADAQESLARARYGQIRAEAERAIAAADVALAVGSTPTETAAATTDSAPPAGAGQGGVR
jgi:outer membrane protein TolC